MYRRTEHPFVFSVANTCSLVNPQTQIFSEPLETKANTCSTNRCLTRGANKRTIGPMTENQLTDRQRGILEFIDQNMRERGFPPSVREIGEAIGLNSPATVHTHLATLQKLGYLRRDPTKPRAMEVRFETSSGVAMDRRPTKHVPLVGDVAAGTDVLAQENIEEIYPLPMDFTGDGELFMLRVRGDSMIDAGIFDGDFVVARQQPNVENGDIVVAGISGEEEATVKTFKQKGRTITLVPSNPRLEPMVFKDDEVVIYGKVVTVIRRF